jgi:hypothetical protein
MRPWLAEHSPDPFIGGINIKSFRVEYAAYPGQHLCVLGMGRVRNGGQERHVAGNAADVLRRAGPFSGDAYGCGPGRVAGLHAFHHDTVRPSIAEVVQVHEFGNVIGQKRSEPLTLLVDDIRVAEIIRQTVGFPVDFELMKMGICPAHGAQDGVTELGQGDRDRYHYPPPDQRLDSQEFNAQSDVFWRLGHV